MRYYLPIWFSMKVFLFFRGFIKWWSAILTELRTFFVSSPVTVGALSCYILFMSFHQWYGNYASGYCNNSVTYQHDTTRKEFPQGGDRSYISVTYGGKRDASPINTVGNIAELRIGFSSFNHVHQCSDRYHQNNHKHKENCDFFATVA